MSNTPDTQPQAPTSLWAKAVEDSLGRVTGFWNEIAKLQAQAHARAVTRTDEAARLTKATLDYGLELSNAWRSMTLDLAGKLLGASTPKAPAKRD